ncbi:hypothetical protein Ddc_01552 [Ditylenchus destructor]|nr:hypothetical protein Ddc_01552 [Ditylenchus destructor]
MRSKQLLKCCCITIIIGMGIMSRVSFAAPLVFSRRDRTAPADNIISQGIPLVLQPSAVAAPAFVTACIVTFQVFEEISTEDIQITRVVSVSSLNECAYVCYQQSCSHAFYEPLNDNESADFNARCSLDTSSLKETCNWNVQRHYSLNSDKPTILSCLRCGPAKPTSTSQDNRYTTPLIQKDYNTNDHETSKSISYHPMVQTELTTTANLENEGTKISADFPTTKSMTSKWMTSQTTLSPQSSTLTGHSEKNASDISVDALSTVTLKPKTNINFSPSTTKFLREDIEEGLDAVMPSTLGYLMSRHMSSTEIKSTHVKTGGEEIYSTTEQPGIILSNDNNVSTVKNTKIWTKQEERRMNDIFSSMEHRTNETKSTEETIEKTKSTISTIPQNVTQTPEETSLTIGIWHQLKKTSTGLSIGQMSNFLTSGTNPYETTKFYTGHISHALDQNSSIDDAITSSTVPLDIKNDTDDTKHLDSEKSLNKVDVKEEAIVNMPERIFSTLTPNATTDETEKDTIGGFRTQVQAKMNMTEDGGRANMSVSTPKTATERKEENNDVNLAHIEPEIRVLNQEHVTQSVLVYEVNSTRSHSMFTGQNRQDENNRVEDAMSGETTVSMNANIQNIDTTESLSSLLIQDTAVRTTQLQKVNKSATTRSGKYTSSEEITESGHQEEHNPLYNTVKNMQTNNRLSNPTWFTESTTKGSPLPTLSDDEISQTENYELLEMPTKPTLPPALINIHRPQSVGVVVPVRFRPKTKDHDYSTEEPSSSTPTSETSSMASVWSEMVPSTQVPLTSHFTSKANVQKETKSSSPSNESQDEIKSTKDIMDDNIIEAIGFDSIMTTTLNETNHGFFEKISAESQSEPTTEPNIVEAVSSLINVMDKRTTPSLPAVEEFNARDDKAIEEVAQLIDSVANHRNNFEELVKSSDGKEGEFGPESMNITEMSGTFRLSHNPAAQNLKIDLYYNKDPKR